MAGILFIISAPSGSGKSTLVSQLRSLVPGLDFSVSYTTRAPRGSEVNGTEYHFTTRQHFEEMIARDEFLEHAEVFGNYYGTHRSALQHSADKGLDLLLDIDVQGAMQVMQRAPDAVSIFIVPPSPAVLEKRLRNRSAAENISNEDLIQRRLAQAESELREISNYDYAIVNDVLDNAVAELVAIVKTERGEGDADPLHLAANCRTAAPSAHLQEALAKFSPS